MLFLIHRFKKISWFFAIIALTFKDEIPKQYESLLNLGPKCVPTNKNLPFTDIITLTESCALDMEHNHKENEAETLRQNETNLNLKIRSNLKKDQRRALKELQKMIKLECTNLIRVVDLQL